MSFKKLHVIINPASGQPYPILHTLNRALSDFPGEWDVSVTKPGKTRALAQAAVDAGCDVVAVYGGDGTIMEAAVPLLNTDIALALLPGGTANILSVELGIPSDLRRACRLFTAAHPQHRKIDVGRFEGDQIFLLRVGFGFEAETVKGADRSSKTQLGWMAYALSGFRAFMRTRPHKYRLRLDGKEECCEGLSLVVANSANLGLPGVSLLPRVSLNDGKLDVILIRSADLSQLFALNDQGRAGRDYFGLFRHWRVKEVHVEASPPQTVQFDGEIMERESLEISVIPQALTVLVPSGRD